MTHNKDDSSISCVLIFALSNKKSKQLDKLIQLIIEAKKNNQYVKYRLYLESNARTRGWSDILKEICPNLSLAEAKAYLYNLQFHDGASDIIKIFSQIIYNIRFKMNDDLLLSGILDIQFIENNHKNLKNVYNSNGVWNELNEKIQIEKLRPPLKDFIENYIINNSTTNNQI
ncbi:6969_t:CDS:2 [Dentiscutata heterogama]|uniref:6969_t:CDS:1 n=1 Tax=Dentiscutata heterogama TaxID=1316150 RepID=A0ACA9K7T8_9GLOM|nr:6969_t:CDS:2 [Dentiscutata heterogama]